MSGEVRLYKKRKKKSTVKVNETHIRVVSVLETVDGQAAKNEIKIQSAHFSLDNNIVGRDRFLCNTFARHCARIVRRYHTGISSKQKRIYMLLSQSLASKTLLFAVLS